MINYVDKPLQWSCPDNSFTARIFDRKAIKEDVKMRVYDIVLNQRDLLQHDKYPHAIGNVLHYLSFSIIIILAGEQSQPSSDVILTLWLWLYSIHYSEKKKAYPFCRICSIYAMHMAS